MPASSDHVNPVQQSYRRFLIDMHIPDWDPTFLSEFSPAALAAAVDRARATVITVPANNHVGLNFWPSAVGRAHRGVGDRDLLADMLTAARRHGLSTVVYYCISYVEWYWETHPESRIVYADGTPRRLRIPTAGSADRFRVCCHNNAAYRDFVLTQVSELATDYDLDGMNIDMTMWPGPCYCPACQERFRREEQADLPLVVDWRDDRWRAFAARRAGWLAEFAGQIDARIHTIRPTATVVHQSGGYVHDWWTGASQDLAGHTDWLSADLYQSREGLSYSLKLFNSLSERKPAELINAWTSPTIFEHVVPRTPAEMETIASVAVAHDCALSVIDAVDPSGSMPEANYTAMKPIFERVRDLEPVLGGRMLHDVAIYHSFTAAFDEHETGRSVADLGYPSERPPHPTFRSDHRSASIRAGRALQAAHLPFGVATRQDLDTLDRWQVLILANVQLLDRVEVEAVTAYVRAGGSLYVSGLTPSQDASAADGVFALSDVLGVRRIGLTADSVTYASPVAAASETFAPFTTTRPLTIHGRQVLVEPGSADVTVLATLTLPYLQPGGEKYASTLTDPPGRPTSYPSIVEHRVGAGRVTYSAGVLEAETHSTQQEVFVRLILRLLARSTRFAAAAPPCVEFTLFERDDLGAHILYSLNRQDTEDAVPIRGATVTVAVPGLAVTAITQCPDGERVVWDKPDPAHVLFTVPEFRTMSVVRIDHRPTAPRA